VYGKTKSLGEPELEGVLNLRCSIVGREPAGGGSLMEWVLSHKKGEALRGFTNHLWNGVSTNAFAHVVAGIVGAEEFVSGSYHLVPSDRVTKYELVSLIAELFDRRDLKISPFEAPQAKDMTLATSFPQMNDFLWEHAGYRGVPTIRDLIQEVSNDG
jgi:dTDP-4-dehydrorhamnose reductase